MGSEDQYLCIRCELCLFPKSSAGCAEAPLEGSRREGWLDGSNDVCKLLFPSLRRYHPP
jgi:hypothetical protein